MNYHVVRTSARGWRRVLSVSAVAFLAQALVPGALQSLLGTDAALPGVAQAQEQQKDQRQTRRTPAISNAVYEKLSEAQVLVEDKKYAEAMKILDGMKAKEGSKALNGYELANLYNLYAFIYYSQERYDDALKAYQMVVAQSPDIPEGMEYQTKFTIAQLFFVTEQWQKGINALQEWMKTQQDPGADIYALLGTGYYQLKDYNKSLSNMERAVSMTKAKGKVPKEQWYSLLRYLYYEKNQYDKVIDLLEEMLVYYPKKDYWVQLSHMYGEKKLDRKQLAAMETVYVQGELDKEKELVQMAYLFLANEVPYKAAKVLDKGIKEKKIEPTSRNLELLGNAWRASQEVKKSIPVMEEAARKSDKGELWARLGNIYLDNDEYKKAVEAVEAGLKKGGVRRPDTAHLVAGMAYFNLKQYEAARRAFAEAAKDKRSEGYAKQWMEFMKKELERQRSLQDA